jgi:hypothetical protein
VITSGGGILAIVVGYDWSQENPATGYDHRITASTFLPLSRVFPPNPPRTLLPGLATFNVLSAINSLYIICSAIFELSICHFTTEIVIWYY